MRRFLVSCVISLLGLTVLTAVSPAYGDATTPVGWGTTGGPFGVVGINSGSAFDFSASSYSLSSMDPLTATMSMTALGTQMSIDTTITSELASQDLLALDHAETARMARLIEEQRRAAAARANASGQKGLKSGAVPAQYEQLVLNAVSQYCPALDPAILAAQIEAESNWNPRAQSPVGAKGIAQFMPGTWASYGVDGNNDGKKDVYDPQDAIPAAAKYDCVVRDIVRNVPGDLDSNMLAGYNAGPGAVKKFNGIPPYQETQKYVTKILARSQELSSGEESTADGSSQTSVDAAGCPTSAPSGTLRGKASKIGINKICADSVAAAPTPEAARAIKFALRNLGAPYSQPKRMQNGYYDCSSFVMRSYNAAGLKVLEGGWAPNTYAIQNKRWAKRISFSSRKPGDLTYPFQGHIAMTLAHGLKVHTNRPGDVSHVNGDYSSAVLTIRVVPSLV